MVDMEDYIKFVEEQIKVYQKRSNLVVDGEVPFTEVNRVLAEYSQVNLALIAEYNRKKKEKHDIEFAYQKWWDRRFVETRNKMIAETESKTIKISVKEIEAQVRYENEEKYEEWLNKKTSAEYQVRFMIRLLDNWKKIDTILVTLSNNARQEMKSLSIETRASEDRDKIRSFENKKRREPVQ
jgi:hypothetical protein